MAKVLYQCEQCGKQYQSKETALSCERSHLMPTEITSVKFDRDNKPMYPAQINIKLSDGRVITYHREKGY